MAELPVASTKAPPAPPPPAAGDAALGPLLDELVALWRLYRRLVGAQIRSEWQYRTSFAFFLLAQALITALELAAIVILLDVVPDLGGWSPAQVALLYGLATVPFALTDLIVSPVEELAVHVQGGTFDRLLLRPVSALIQLCALEFELRRAGKLIPNVATLVVGLVATDVELDVRSLGLLAIGLASGSAIYAALWILSASISFWAVSALQATHAFTYGGQFANQYPLHLYPGWIRAILGWLIPLAFVAYVPAIELIGAPNPLGLPGWLVLLSPLAGVGALAVALTVWTTGIRHYQSTGS